MIDFTLTQPQYYQYFKEISFTSLGIFLPIRIVSQEK